MSQENVDVGRAVFEAWQARDPQAALSRIDADVEADLTAASVWGDASVGRGHAALGI
jgi:hypothetical protein